MVAGGTQMRTVDGHLIESIPVGGGLYRVSIDGELQPDLYSRSEIRLLLVGGPPETFTRSAEGDYIDHGQQGVVFAGRDPSTVTKLVFLPDPDRLLAQRTTENRVNSDPWASLHGTSILTSNRQQADLFSALHREPGPDSLPRITDYREGPLDPETRRRLISSGIPGNHLPPLGWPTAVWTMERLTPVRLEDDMTDRERRQALDYLWREHRMVVRDIGGDSGNWGVRDDGSLVLSDPLVVDVSPFFPSGTDLPTTHAAIMRHLRRRRDSVPGVMTLAPFGYTLDNGADNLALALLAVSIAYRVPDRAFDELVMDYRHGRPSDSPLTYLSFPHRSRPFT